MAVGTDDFPTLNHSCYSYSKCRKLHYSVGVGFFLKHKPKCFLIFPPRAFLDISPSGISAVLVIFQSTT